MQQTFRCPECGAEFPTQQSLQDHVSREHMGTSTQARTPAGHVPGVQHFGFAQHRHGVPERGEPGGS
jgi:C2H2-type zinc finger